MKKLVAVFMMFVVFGFGTLAQAEMYHTGCLYVEVQGDAFLPIEDDQLDDSFYAGGRVGYQVSDMLSFEAEGGWAEADFVTGGGDIRIIPALVNVRFTFAPGVYVIDPYIFGGAGYSFNDVSLAGVDVDDSFAAQGGVGIRFHVSDSFAIYGEGRYFWSEADVNVPLFGENELDLSAIVVGGGVTFKF